MLPPKTSANAKLVQVAPSVKRNELKCVRSGMVRRRYVVLSDARKTIPGLVLCFNVGKLYKPY